MQLSPRHGNNVVSTVVNNGILLKLVIRETTRAHLSGATGTPNLPLSSLEPGNRDSGSSEVEGHHCLGKGGREQNGNDAGFKFHCLIGASRSAVSSSRLYHMF